MILQIRTKDNLEALLKQGNSPAWVIAESRVPEIQSVEIYQFDGKRVLKADFDAANSTRTESDRLVVAFKNGVIEDSDMDWNGQNPVRYKDVTSNETPETENELFDNWIPFSELEKIEQAYQSKSELLPDILKEIVDKYNFNFSGRIYTSSYEELLYSVNEVSKIYCSDIDKFNEDLNNIKESENDDTLKWHEVFSLLSKGIKNNNGVIIKTLYPSGGEDFSCLVFNNKKIINSVILLYHFYDALGQASGWHNEFIESYNISYDDFLVNNKLSDDISISDYDFSIKEDGFFGPEINSNKDYMNITRVVHSYAIAGMLAARKFC